jgi:hypothetical protein
MSNLTPIDRTVLVTPGFKAAFMTVAGMLRVNFRRDVLYTFNLYLGNLKAGRPGNPRLECAVAMMVALAHLMVGAPLYLSDSLYEKWITECTGASSECVKCAYRHPATYRRCVLCGAVTGALGCRDKARAARAAWN